VSEKGGISGRLLVLLIVAVLAWPGTIIAGWILNERSQQQEAAARRAALCEQGNRTNEVIRALLLLARTTRPEGEPPPTPAEAEAQAAFQKKANELLRPLDCDNLELETTTEEEP
jgi:hypothetical protein